MANGGQGYNGYNPTQNQSEYGAPVGLRNTRYGQTWAAFRKSFALGSQTYLPGPYHYEDQVGLTKGAPYWPAAVYQFRGTFNGNVPLYVAPRLQLPAPWNRKAPA
jgi:hypothetical protein